MLDFIFEIVIFLLTPEPKTKAGKFAYYFALFLVLAVFIVWTVMNLNKWLTFKAG